MKFFNALLLISTVFASETESDVLTLTANNYQSTLDDNSLILIEYYAPWCGHCKALAPEYEKAATELKDLPVKLAKVDCTEEADICQAQGVQGYPTLKVFRDGTPSDYQKGRTATDIVAYLKKQLLPAVSDVTADNFETLKTDNSVVVVGYFSDKDGAEYKAFESVANKLRDDFVFGVIAEDKLTTANGQSVGDVVLYKKFDELKNVFPDNIQEKGLTEESLNLFITVNSVPLVDEIGPENYMKYVESGLPLAYMFVQNDEERKSIGEYLSPLAKEHRGKVSFVFIDAVLFGGHAKNLNLNEEWPAFAIQEPEENAKFPLTDKLSKESVTEFVEKYVAGELKPSVKSEPIPETNDEPVKVVVGDSFKDLVMDAEKDVLIELYAVWCGHCKRLAPIYDELASTLSGVSSIVVAKMEATENDLPTGLGFTVEGFPTIKLFKAKTNEIVDFSGDRTVEGFVKFLSENAAIPFEAPEVSPAASSESEAEAEEDEDVEIVEDAEEEVDHDEL